MKEEGGARATVTVEVAGSGSNGGVTVTVRARETEGAERAEPVMQRLRAESMSPLVKITCRKQAWLGGAGGGLRQ